MWVKLDDHFPDHRKLAELGDYAPLCGWLYICGLAYCNRQLTDGRIPKAHVHRLASFRHVGVVDEATMAKWQTEKQTAWQTDAERLAKMLVSVCLWEDDGEYYVVHDYGHYQLGKGEVEELRRIRAEAGAAGAKARWQNKQTHSKLPSKPHSKPIAKSCPVPVPVPDPVPDPDPKPVPQSNNECGADTPPSRHARNGNVLFERFWSAYPRHTARAEAYREWQKLHPSETLTDLILDAIARQKRTRQWREGVIPHARTWLHQQRWEDDVGAELARADVRPGTARSIDAANDLLAEQDEDRHDG